MTMYVHEWRHDHLVTEKKRTLVHLADKKKKKKSCEQHDRPGYSWIFKYSQYEE